MLRINAYLDLLSDDGVLDVGVCATVLGRYNVMAGFGLPRRPDSSWLVTFVSRWDELTLILFGFHAQLWVEEY